MTSSAPPPRRRINPLFIILPIVGGLGFFALVIALLVNLVFAPLGTYLAHSGLDDNAGENSRYDENYDPSHDYLIDTPCFAFSGPEGWINHQKDAFAADCMATLEDHGPRDDSGRFVFDNFQTNDYGSLVVQPNDGTQSVKSADVELDGADASLTRESTAGGIMETATIEVVMPAQHSNYYGTFDALVIQIEAPSAELDDIIDELISTWTWK